MAQQFEGEDALLIDIYIYMYVYDCVYICKHNSQASLTAVTVTTDFRFASTEFVDVDLGTTTDTNFQSLAPLH